MSQIHDSLKKDALSAIKKIFGDTTVSQQTTIDSLREIVDTAEDYISSIEADLSAQDDLEDS